MKYLWLLGLFTITSCSSGPSVLTMSAFYEIPVGSSREEVIMQAGDPYSIQKKEDGSEELVYVERITAGARFLQQHRYIITIKNGIVISKRVERKSPSPNTFDSYEMQTTQM
jgi:hypothetical protein